MAGLAVGVAIATAGGSPEDAAKTVADVARSEGATTDEAAEIAGEAAATVVMMKGGTRGKSGRGKAKYAAAEAAKAAGGSPQAQAAAAGAAVAQNGGTAREVGAAAAEAAVAGGAGVAEARAAAVKAAGVMPIGSGGLSL